MARDDVSAAAVDSAAGPRPAAARRRRLGRVLALLQTDANLCARLRAELAQLS